MKSRPSATALKLLITLGSTGACVILAYVVNFIYNIDVVYTHTFYVPIILSAIWYYKKTFVVAGLLSLVHLMLSYFADGSLTYASLLRVTIFIVVAAVVCTISESRRNLAIELQQKESELHEKASRMENIIAGTNAGTWEWNVLTGKVIANSRWAHISGYDMDELENITFEKWTSFFHPEDVKERDLQLQKLFAGEIEHYEVELRLKHKSGQWIWISSRGKVNVWSDAGEPLVVSGIHLDITSRKSATEKIENDETRFRELLESLDAGVVAHAADSSIIDCNERAEKLLGLSKEQMLGKLAIDPRWTFIKEDKTQMPLEEYPIEVILRTKKPIKEQILGVYHGDTNYINWLTVNGTAIYDRLGEISEVVISFIDITERKKMEIQLQESLDDLLESQRVAHIGTWRLDLATNQVVWSEELYKMYGFDPTIPPPPYTEHMKLFTPESWNQLSSSLALTSTAGIPYELELKTVKADGTNGWMWVRGEAVKDAYGKITTLHGAAQDITERKQMELQLRESEERFKLLFDKAPLGYQSLDIDGNFLEVNQKWLDIFGYQKEDVVGKWFGDFLAPGYKEGFRKRFPIFKEQGFIHSEFEMVGKNGDTKFIAFDGKIGYTRDGAFQQTHCILKDITVETALAAELDESRKLMEATLISVGDGVISSDINGAIQFMNPVAERLTGWSQEEAKGKKIEDVFYIINELTGERSESITKLVVESGNIVGLANHTALISKSGERRPIEDCAAPIVLENGEIIGVVVVFSDFSEKQKKLEEIEYLSYHDYLTGLYNRRFFEEELKRYDVTRNLPLSIVMGDVNGLKLINDSFGHATGDELLKRSAQLILKACRTDDIIARLGGDEFVILLPKSNEADAEGFIKRVQEELFEEKIDEIPLSISFGFASKVQEGETMTNVLKSAEDHMYRHKLYESTGERSKTVNLIINTLYEKNHREMLHSKRVSELSSLIATALGFNPDDVNQMKTAGLMHDIGKIGVEESILNKVERLTESEWNEIKKHCEIGYRILSSVPEFSEIADFVLEHQEKWDGTGYPRGLKGDEISLGARIIAIADAYDAMTGQRSYGQVRSKSEAIEEVLRCAGTQFDPELVKVFIKALKGTQKHETH